MKKFMLLFCFSFVFFTFPAKIHAQDGLNINVHMSGPVEVAARLFGLGKSTKVSIQNMVPFYTEVIFIEDKGDHLEEKVFRVNPTGEIYDGWRFEFPSSVLPVFFRFYDDNSFAHLIGVGGTVLLIEKDRPTNFPIKRDQVRFLNGNYSSYSWVSPYPQPDLVPPRKVDMPRIEQAAVNIFGAINGTLFDVGVDKGDGRRRILKPGEVCWYEVRDIYHSESYIVKFVYSDRGRSNGYADSYRVDTDPNGPRANQVFLIPQGISQY